MNTLQQEIKKQIVSAWKPGDDTRVAEKVRDLYPHLAISPETVRLWRLGLRPKSKIQVFVLEAALEWHRERRDVGCVGAPD